MRARAAEVQVEAVRWLARLPFLGAEEVSLLLGTAKPYAARLLAELESLGWAEWVTPSSSELDTERLYVLTDACPPKLAKTLCVGEAEPLQSLAVGRREVLERLVRLETVVGLNRFGAQLVSAVRDDEEVELVEFRSLPWRRRRAQTWWPPEIEAFGCLRWGPWRAPFFVAWDRAGAPAFHRRKRVSAWYTFREGPHPWGRDDVPPILVVCPGESEAMQWAQAALAAADRRKTSPLPMFLGVLRETESEGPVGPAWRRPDGTARAYLCERLPWRPAVPEEATGLPAMNSKSQLEPMTDRTVPLREWARQAAALPVKKQQKSGIEYLAALSVVSSAMGKRILEWLGHHPLLSADDLSVVLRVSSQLVRRLLSDLVVSELVNSTDERLKGEAVAVQRYFLTHVGLKLLAARDGVPPRRYLRHGIIASPSESKKGGGRLDTLLRQLDHTVGANCFFVRLIADGGNGRPRLVRWLSPSEAVLKFTHGEITHWLRPDGAGDIHWKGKVHRFYLEWDRGTIGWPEMTEKLRGYVAYLAAMTDKNGNMPQLLIVTTSPARENVMWRIVDDAFNDLRLPSRDIFTTIDSLLSGLGTLASIWRTSSDSARQQWGEATG